MEIRFTKKQIKDLLEGYYKLYKKIECAINIKTEIGGIDRYDTEGCIVTITQTKKAIVFGSEHTVHIPLRKEEIKEAFKAILRDEGYELTDLIYDEDIRGTWIGYGMGEQYYKRPYFGGFIVYANEKRNGKEKVLGG